MVDYHSISMILAGLHDGDCVVLDGGIFARIFLGEDNVGADIDDGVILGSGIVGAIDGEDGGDTVCGLGNNAASTCKSNGATFNNDSI